MEKTKQINVNVSHGDAFFADSITVADNKEKFIFDFKHTSPRFDPAGQGGKEQQTSLVIKHNTVMANPVLAKTFHEMLGERIKQHEKMFGKIETIKKKKGSKKGKKDVPVEVIGSRPTYFG